MILNCDLISFIVKFILFFFKSLREGVLRMIFGVVKLVGVFELLVVKVKIVLFFLMVDVFFVVLLVVEEEGSEGGRVISFIRY